MNPLRLLHKRVSVRIHIEDPTLPTVMASTDSGPAPGNWFSANFGVGNALSVAGLAITLIGGYVALQSSIVDLRARDDAEKAEISRQAEVITRINQRLTDGYVHHDDYVENNLKISQQLSTVQSQQLQIYGTLLAGKEK